MALRLNSLKTRTALAIVSVIVAILLANALYLILTKRAELRDGIEKRRAHLRPPHPGSDLHRLQDLLRVGLLQVPRADPRPADASTPTSCAS